MKRRGEVLHGSGLADLRRMHHRRMKHHIVGEQRIKPAQIAVFDKLMPCCQG